MREPAFSISSFKIGAGDSLACVQLQLKLPHQIADLPQALHLARREFDFVTVGDRDGQDYMYQRIPALYGLRIRLTRNDQIWAFQDVAEDLLNLGQQNLIQSTCRGRWRRTGRKSIEY